MKLPKLVPALALLPLLGACEMRLGHEEEEAGAPANVSAAGKAEEGQLSVSAPGFEMKLDIPEAISRRAEIEDHGGLVYPGARFSGIHVQGGREDPAGQGDGEVELRFTSGDAPDALARWYQDSARASDFSIASSGREGEAMVLAGTTREDDGRFTVRLSPRSGGGTDGRLVLSDRR